MTPERTHEVILNAMSEMVVCHDTTLTIAWANRAAGMSAGVAAEALVGCKCYAVWHHRTAPCEGCPIQRVLQTGAPAHGDLRTPDGRNWTIHGSPLRDAQGRIIGAIELAQDSTARTTMAEALRESEERFHTLVEKTNDIIWELNAAGVYTYMNAPGLAVAGYKREEVLGKTPLDFMPPVDAERIGAVLRGIVTRREPFALLRSTLRHKDGHVLEIETNGAPMFNVQGVYLGYRGISRDITARVRAEDALRVSEARYRALVELSPEAILQVGADGSISSANQQAATLLGVARTAALAGKNLLAYVAPDDRARVQAGLQQARTAATTSSIECVMLHARTRRFHGEITLSCAADAGHTAGDYVLIIRNVSTRKNAQEVLQHQHEHLGQTLDRRTQELHSAHALLQASEERFRVVAEHAHDGINICVIEPQTGRRRLVYCNDRYAAIAGFTRAQLLAAENLNALITQHSPDLELQRHVACVLNGTPFSGMASWHRPDGQENIYEYTAVSLKKGDEIFIIGVDRDVTERHQAEQRLHDQVAEILAIFNGIEAAMYVADLHTHEILAVNHYLEHRHGQGLLGQKCYAALQAEQSQPCAFCNNNQLTGPDGQPGPPLTWEARNATTGLWYRCISRAIRWPDGRLVRMELSFDITAEVAARQALRVSEANLAEAQRIARIGSWTWDMATGVVTWSDELKRIAGLALDAPAPTFPEGHQQIIHPDDMPHLAAAVRRAVDHGTPYELDVRLMQPAGGLCCALTRGEAVRNASGAVIALIGTVQDISERKHAEVQLQTYADQLRGLASEVTLVEERERRRVAALLHDHVCQLLVLLKIRMSFLRAAADARLHPACDEVARLLDESIQTTRTLTCELSPPVLYELGLGPALEWLSEQLQRDHPQHLIVRIPARAAALNSDMRMLVFMAVREVVINALKHAAAQTIEICMTETAHTLTVVVRDDGVGFIADAVGAHNFGLFKTRERIGYLGGSVQVASTPGAGTRVTLTVPVREEHAQSAAK
ncbi:MAG: PAS domain S-box protein [bacterium]|nr:PAS domain S-box protein [bacterium]